MKARIIKLIINCLLRSVAILRLQLWKTVLWYYNKHLQDIKLQIWWILNESQPFFNQCYLFLYLHSVLCKCAVKPCKASQGSSLGFIAHAISARLERPSRGDSIHLEQRTSYRETKKTSCFTQICMQCWRNTFFN